jgi:hypothetical protein
MRLLYDFYTYYSVGRLALKGQNYYDPGILRAEMLSHGWPLDHQVWGFPYPPWCAAFFAPIALLPFEAAELVWFLLSAGAIFYCWKLSIQLAQSFTRAGCSADLKLIHLLLFFPAVKLLLFGQAVFIPLLGFMIFLSSGSGAALSLISIKPHLIAPVAVAICMNCIRRKKFSTLLGFALGFLIQCLIAWIIAPQGFAAYAEALRTFQGGETSVLNYPNIEELLSLSFGLHISSFLIWGIALAAGAVYGWLRPLDYRLLILVGLPLCLLITPHLWSHDLVFLMPVYAAVVLRYGAKPSPAVFLLLLFTFFLFSSSLLLKENHEFYTVWITIVLGLFGAIIFNNEKGENGEIFSHFSPPPC